MPRGPRLDIEGALYHVIARGVEKRAIFRTDRDREDFLARLAGLLGEEDVVLFAHALMGNHFHLVLRRGSTPLGQFMRRLLTGYTVAFNLRHRRVGHLFQNRYHSVVCEEDAYLLQLVRYVHLNPLRARLVSDPAEYLWSSHGAYLSRYPPDWIETTPVLSLLGGRGAYRRFIAEGYEEGERAELCGRRRREAGHEEPRLWLAGRILGNERFARRMVKASRGRELEREMERGRAEELPGLAEKAAVKHGLTMKVLRDAGRKGAVSAARRELIRVAVVERGIRPVEVSRWLRISTASVAEHLAAIRRDERE